MTFTTTEDKSNLKNNKTNLSDKDFYWVDYAEPHKARRRKILQDHPEVRTLYGSDPLAFLSCLIIVFGQLFCTFYVTNYVHNWMIFLLIAYIFGGTFNHAATLGMHECSHNSIFGSIKYDRWVGMFVNLPLVFPSSVTFRKYHLEHHNYQGVDVIDADIPSNGEGFIFRKDSPLRKLIWVALQPLFYGLRPLLTYPKSITFWEVVNIIVQITFDLIIFNFFGFKGLLYLLSSTLLGLSLHPLAGHFIAEHYISKKGQETYSYYGPLNLVSFNVGYHNEHHDFMNIPGSRLPLLRKMAPEHYNNLHHYDSWLKVVLWYIFSTSASPFARIKRTKDTHDKGMELLRQQGSD